MRITEITTTRRGRYSIFIDNEFYGVLHPDIYFVSKVKQGMLVEQGELDELIAESGKLIAKERALRLLSARSYTARNLSQKLKTHADEETVQAVVKRMEEIGLVNDYDYARRYALDCLRLKGFSYHRTIFALQEKGISKQVAEQVLRDRGNEDSEWIIAQFILRKYSRRIGNEKDEKRTINAMLRRGHSYEEIRRVVENLRENMGYYSNYLDPYEE